MAKPPLKLVDQDQTTAESPRKLGKHGLSLWERVQSDYAITDVGGTELLAQACQATDRAEALGEQVARDGEVIYTKSGGVKTHPAIKEELALRAFICRTLQRLGLNVEAVRPIGRPGRVVSWTPPA